MESKTKRHFAPRSNNLSQVWTLPMLAIAVTTGLVTEFVPAAMKSYALRVAMTPMNAMFATSITVLIAAKRILGLQMKWTGARLTFVKNFVQTAD